METIFNFWETNRKLYLEYLEKYSLEQLNTIPKGFNNSLIWNIGHIIVVQQGLLYKSSGLSGYLTEDMFNRYKPGTVPTRIAEQSDVNELKELLISLIEKTKIDFKNQQFNSFEARKISLGFNLDSITDAIIFNNYHEALHLGYMMGMKKFI